MGEEQDLVGPMVCNHCGNETVFKREGIYDYRYKEEDLEFWESVKGFVVRPLTCECVV